MVKPTIAIKGQEMDAARGLAATEEPRRYQGWRAASAGDIAAPGHQSRREHEHDAGVGQLLDRVEGWPGAGAWKCEIGPCIPGPPRGKTPHEVGTSPRHSPVPNRSAT